MSLEGLKDPNRDYMFIGGSSGVVKRQIYTQPVMQCNLNQNPEGFALEFEELNLRFIRKSKCARIAKMNLEIFKIIKTAWCSDTERQKKSMEYRN